MSADMTTEDRLARFVIRYGDALENVAQAVEDRHGALSLTAFLDCFEGYEDLLPDRLVAYLAAPAPAQPRPTRPVVDDAGGEEA